VIEGECSHKVASAPDCFKAAQKYFGASLNLTTWSGVDEKLPNGCSFNILTDSPGKVMVYFNTKGSGVCAESSEGKTAGVVNSLVHVKVQLAKGTVQLTLTGPATVWYGVGFGAQQMSDKPWAIIVDGFGNVTERKLGYHNRGEQLPPTVTVVSNVVQDNKRTVVLTRAMKGNSSAYFTFTASGNIDIINAYGSTKQLLFHANKSPAKIALLPLVSGKGRGAASCLCSVPPPAFGKATGYLQYNPVEQAGEAGPASRIPFSNLCEPEPRSDMLAMKNPTCDIRTYSGGQIACHHLWSLLDADQAIPWVNQPLKYYLKFRFWVQPYDASYHQTVKRETWGIASPVEYDVPKCKKGMMGCSLAKDGTWIHTITGTYMGKGKLVAAHYHCHAPTCLSMTIYRNDTREVICEERPIYGGSGKADLKKFDEPGYIAQPPCLWGSPEFGLEEPIDVTGVMLHTVKTSNASYGHHGEMAWQQMFYV